VYGRRKVQNQTERRGECYVQNACPEILSRKTAPSASQVVPLKYSAPSGIKKFSKKGREMYRLNVRKQGRNRKYSQVSVELAKMLFMVMVPMVFRNEVED